MLWVLLFTAGLIVLLAGVSSMILRGPRLANGLLSAVGLVLLGAGIGGVIVRPHLPELTFAESSSPAPIEKASQPASETVVAVAPPPDTEPAPAPTAAAPQKPVAPAPADAAANADKDESQLQPAHAPVPVTTTTVTGSPPDPLADPAPVTTVPPPSAEATAPAAAQPPAPAQPSAAAPAAVAPAPAAPAAPAAPSDADRLASLADRQPKDEAAFVKAVSSARTAFDKANDDNRVALQPQRAAAICAAVKKADIQGWVGMLGDMDRDAGGRTILSMQLPDGTTLKTWNNAMSDLDDKTLVLAGTPLAATLGKLQRGDLVRFSGSFFGDDSDCYRSTRLSLDQSMTEPSFLFRFTAIEKL